MLWLEEIVDGGGAPCGLAICVLDGLEGAGGVLRFRTLGLQLFEDFKGLFGLFRGVSRLFLQLRRGGLGLGQLFGLGIVFGEVGLQLLDCCRLVVEQLRLEIGKPDQGNHSVVETLSRSSNIFVLVQETLRKWVWEKKTEKRNFEKISVFGGQKS